MTITLTIESTSSLHAVMDALKTAPKDVSLKFDPTAEKELRNRKYIQEFGEAIRQVEEGRVIKFNNIDEVKNYFGF